MEIDHPQHYQGNKLEAIDIIEDFSLGFNLGNAIKYIIRAGKKNDWEEDIRKAIWYLQRELEKKGITHSMEEPINLTDEVLQLWLRVFNLAETLDDLLRSNPKIKLDMSKEPCEERLRRAAEDVKKRFPDVVITAKLKDQQ